MLGSQCASLIVGPLGNLEDHVSFNSRYIPLPWTPSFTSKPRTLASILLVCLAVLCHTASV